MVLSRPPRDAAAIAAEPRPVRAGDRRSRGFRIPALIAVLFGGAAIVSADLFARVSDGGAPFAMVLVAVLPLQAVALLWVLSQRKGQVAVPDQKN